MFYPTKLHVTVTMVAPGKTYVMPPPTSDDADAGTPPVKPMRDAGTATAGSATTTAPKAGQGAPTAMSTTPGTTTAGRGAAAVAGSAGRATAGNASQRLDAGTTPSAADYLDHGSSCSLVSPPRAAHAWPSLVLLSFVFVARSLFRRRRH
jgi:hypothetical protein